MIGGAVESFNQRRRVVATSTVAVVVALALAASVTYAFGSNLGPGGTTTIVNTQVNSIDCTKVSGHQLTLGQQPIPLSENGTATLGGRTYWYATFIPRYDGSPNSTIMFHGVNFTFTMPIAPGVAEQGHWIFLNQTVMITSSSGGDYCAYWLPPVVISFGDGASVAYNSETITSTGTGGIIAWDKPTSNPWFSDHLSPQAGLQYQSSGGEITLYVSSENAG